MNMDLISSLPDDNLPPTPTELTVIDKICGKPTTQSTTSYKNNIFRILFNIVIFILLAISPLKTYLIKTFKLYSVIIIIILYSSFVTIGDFYISKLV